MHTFQLQILTEDRVFYQGECQSLIVPSLDGQLGIQACHSNMIAALVPGKLWFQPPGEAMRPAAVSLGLVKVENNTVLVLTDSAERPEDINASRARRAAEAAMDAMLRKRSMREYYAAKAALSRANNRLRILEDAGKQ